MRLTGTRARRVYGYSLYEFEVYGDYAETSVSTAQTAYQIPEKDGSVAIPVRLNRAATVSGDRALRHGRRHRRGRARTTRPPPGR